MFYRLITWGLFLQFSRALCGVAWGDATGNQTYIPVSKEEFSKACQEVNSPKQTRTRVKTESIRFPGFEGAYESIQCVMSDPKYQDAEVEPYGSSDRVPRGSDGKHLYLADDPVNPILKRIAPDKSHEALQAECKELKSVPAFSFVQIGMSVQAPIEIQLNCWEKPRPPKIVEYTTEEIRIVSELEDLNRTIDGLTAPPKDPDCPPTDSPEWVKAWSKVSVLPPPEWVTDFIRESSEWKGSPVIGKSIKDDNDFFLSCMTEGVPESFAQWGKGVGGLYHMARDGVSHFVKFQDDKPWYEKAIQIFPAGMVGVAAKDILVEDYERIQSAIRFAKEIETLRNESKEAFLDFLWNYSVQSAKGIAAEGEKLTTPALVWYHGLSPSEQGRYFCGFIGQFAVDLLLTKGASLLSKSTLHFASKFTAFLERISEGKIAFIAKNQIKPLSKILGPDELIAVIDRKKLLDLGYKPNQIKPILELLPEDLAELENLVDFVDQMGRSWTVVDIDTVKNAYVYSVTDKSGVSALVEIPLQRVESHIAKIKILKKDGSALHDIDLEFVNVNSTDQARWQKAVEKLIQSSTEDLVNVIKKVRIQESKNDLLGHVISDGDAFEPVIYVNKVDLTSQYGLSNKVLDKLGGSILKETPKNVDTSALGVLRHEFGHLLQRNKIGMTAEKLKTWESIAAKDKSLGGGQVSRYGSTHIEEDFAETVALYLQNPNSNSVREVYANRFQYLDELFKNEPDLLGKTAGLLRNASYQTAEQLGWVTKIDGGVFLKMGSAYYYAEESKALLP